MDPLGFRWAPGGWDINEGWHQFGPPTFELHQVIAVANEKEDGCTVDRLEWDEKDNRFFKVYIKNIKRNSMGERAKYKFHVLFSTAEGKAYKQTVEHDGRTKTNYPVELVMSTYEVSSK